MTKTEEITPANRSKQRDEPMGIPRNSAPKAREQSRIQGAIWFWYRFPLVEKQGRDFLCQSQSVAIASA